ncbi:hypothetical protein PLEOSDRAFT_1078511 [Pleurotus ostreatus PC15]|uniref:AB hydrolase-1 domain-containing protein n=1 Tax=Pleurotus ostreatus (strain PC15) TaxID=1137138 RepID=A0A067NBR1_PLEO1|nr:hypothetical protein PLEOSDRAFT_1078511 [Pleurotus ostreatus PC15]
MSPVTSKYLKSSDGTTIYAEAKGDSSKPSIVFLHGFTLSAAVWDGLFDDPKLLDKFYLVRYDMRGHGRSGKPNTPEGHTSALYAADFTAVANGFALNKPVFVGCDICANVDPLPIAGAVALGGSPGISPEMVGVAGKPFLFAALPKFNDNSDVAFALRARVEFIDALFNNPDKIPFSLKMRYLGETVLQSPDVSSVVSLRPQDPSKMLEAGARGLPLQILFGKQDKFLDGEAVVNIVKPHFKNLTVSLIDGGHALFDDNQAELVDELSKFVLSVQFPKKPVIGVDSCVLLVWSLPHPCLGISGVISPLPSTIK